jgi:hypothetical protein
MKHILSAILFIALVASPKILFAQASGECPAGSDANCTATNITTTNNNTNTNTSTSTNTNNNNNVNTSTSTNTNNNTNNNVNVNTSTSTSTSNNNNTNNNNNVNTSTSDNTNRNINESNSNSNVTSNNVNTNNNTNRNINETSITQEIKSPPPSAIAPSIGSSFSQDLCTTGISGAVQTQIFGLSAGRSVTDENCERIKLSKTLYDMGMRVAAVSLMCQDERVFMAMRMAGTPCPFEGMIGAEAQNAWDANPQRLPEGVDITNNLEVGYELQSKRSFCRRYPNEKVCTAD